MKIMSEGQLKMLSALVVICTLGVGVAFVMDIVTRQRATAAKLEEVVPVPAR